MRQTADLYDFKVTWEPFLLRPGIPMEGVEKPPQYRTVDKNGNLYKAGVEVGIDFTGKTTHFPNTLTGHQMMEYSKSLDSTMAIQNQVAEQIFQGYFTDGVKPDRALMDKIATNLNFDMAAYNSYMDSPANFTNAEQSAMYWRSVVKSGAPYFIINDKPQFSGAQSSDTFVKVFANIAKAQL